MAKVTLVINHDIAIALMNIVRFATGGVFLDREGASHMTVPYATVLFASGWCPCYMSMWIAIV